MAEAPWRKLRTTPDGGGTFVRPIADGRFEVREVENESALLEACKERRKALDDQPPSATGTTSGSMRLVADLPRTAEMEMQDKCGQDPDLRRRWLRDHPQYHAHRTVKQDLPRHKTYFYLKRKAPGR